jgi:hypothetical protein
VNTLPVGSRTWPFETWNRPIAAAALVVVELLMSFPSFDPFGLVLLVIRLLSQCAGRRHGTNLTL